MSKQIIYPRTRALRHLLTVPEEVYYETSIDIPALHDLARKAAGNKSKVAKDGPVSVRILEIKKLTV